MAANEFAPVTPGPLPTCCDVRDLVVIRGNADLTRTSSFGRY
jgi:hypothetical protein